MARGGEIVLPELRDRREDIPILFYFTVKDFMVPEISEEDYFDIELSTYEALMDHAIQWEGNVRELQALAREIFKLAGDEHNHRIKRGEKPSANDEKLRLTFRGSHVRTARQNLARKSLPSPETLVESA